MFRNVRFLRFTGHWPESEEKLDEALASAGFTPCGPLTEITSGWEAPVETADGRLARRVGGADLIQLRSQSRLLPASALNEAVELRVDEYRERMGEPPGRREKHRLKLETRDNLLPKALLRSERTKGFYLASEGILAIDAASPAKVERFLDMLRAGIGRFDVDELQFGHSVESLIKRIFLGDAVPSIKLGRECRMQDPADSKSAIRWAEMDLAEPGVRKHVRDGLRLTHLGIEFNGVMSCVLDENGGLGKIKFLGMDAKDASEEEEPLARFDAEFVLLAGTLRQFIETLHEQLGTPTPGG